MSSKDKDKKSQLMDLATLDDFVHINPASIMAMSNSLHFHTLEHAFRESAQTAENAGDAAAFRAYNVLAVVCSYHFNPSRPDTFSPQIIFKSKRTLIPSDYLGEQQEVLVQIAEQIDHPLRIPRHLDTQPTIIWTLVPRALGHLIHVHLDRQSERSDAGLHC